MPIREKNVSVAPTRKQEQRDKNIYLRQRISWIDTLELATGPLVYSCVAIKLKRLLLTVLLPCAMHIAISISYSANTLIRINKYLFA